jgi:hypothetical protein
MLRRNLKELGSRPRMLLAYADAAHASECGRHFRRLGWEVQMVASGAEARELADRFNPDVIVYDADLRDDNAWLTSADVQVVIVANDAAQHADFPDGDFVVRREDGPQALAEFIVGKSYLSEAV